MPTMPESISLHVQASDSQTIRVVEVRGNTARIGRAPYCEVRLNDPEVPHEACRLRRQGGGWTLIPSGGRSGACVLVEFEPLEAPRSIAPGVPFRVGPYRLSLETAEASEPAWGAREIPRVQPLEPQGATVEFNRAGDRGWVAEIAPAATSAPRTVAPAPAPDAGWGSREPGHDRWTRQEEQARRWESRFRAVGEKLRASSKPPAEPAATAPSAWIGARSRPSSDLPRREQKRPVRPAAGIPPVAPGVPRIEPVGSRTAPVGNRPVPSAHSLSRPSTLAPAVEPVPSPPRPSAAPVPGIPAKGLFSAPSPRTHRLPHTSERVVRRRDSAEDTSAPLAFPQDPLKVATDLEETEPTRMESTAARVSVPNASVEGQSAGTAEIEDLTPPAGAISPGIEQDFNHAQDLESLRASGDDPEEFDDEDRYVEEDRPARLVLGATRRGPVIPDISPVEGAHADTDFADADDQAWADDFSPEEDEGAGTTPQPAVSEIVPPAEAPRDSSPGPEPLPSHAEAREEEWACPDPIVADTAFGTGSAWADASPIVEATEPGDWRSRSQPRHGSSARLRADAPDPGRVGVSRNALGGTRGPVRELPTVADILAAQSTRPAGRRPGRPPEKRVDPVTRPLPTGSRPPGQWNISLWLGWLPSAAAVVVAGGVGCFAGWTWTWDGYNAGVVVARLGQTEPGKKPLPEGVAPGRSVWWASQASHLLEWAVYLDRTATEPTQAAEARALLDRASEVSPLHTGVRYTLARAMPGDRDSPPLTRALGQSRDVLALAWSGRRLLASGKKEAALRAYASALEMASTADLAGMGSPSFLDDTETRRYALPAEDVVGTVIRDMAEQSGWTYADWSGAIPRGTVATVVAARILRERGANEAEAALDFAVSDAAEMPGKAGPEGAVLLAAQAEALAMRGRWADARDRYRLAIDRMPFDVVRRSWWMNLAEISLRLNEEPSRLKALDMAKSGDTKDEITMRAVELQKAAGLDGRRTALRTARATDPKP